MRNQVAVFFSFSQILPLAFAITFSGFAQAQLANAPDAATPSGANKSTAADFYVAANGNDANAGTLSAPFLTVDRARLAVQAFQMPDMAAAACMWMRERQAYW